ncbi:MAG: hypothetical protein ACRCWD_07085 [Culicoidibacterales bacterium]
MGKRKNKKAKLTLENVTLLIVAIQGLLSIILEIVKFLIEISE